MLTSVRIFRTESQEQRHRRLAAQRAMKEDRAEKLYRTRHGGARDDVELANVFSELGLLNEFLSRQRDDALRLIPSRMERVRRDHVSDRIWLFLQENFDAEQVEDAEGRVLLHFPLKPKGDELMKLLREVSETTGIPRKQVRKVYDTLLDRIKAGLKKERAVKLPELGKLTVKYRPPRAKRKGINPFTKKPTVFKAKPAQNKLRFRPAKSLRKFADKLPVIAPRKKKGKKRRSR